MVPVAVGESQGTVVFWDPNPEIGIAWPRPVQMVDEIKWGIGSLDHRECLVLYLFIEKASIEVYLENRLPTTPTESVDVWRLMCQWDPQVLKVRFGDTPSDGQHEVTFLLPAGEGLGAVDGLRELRRLTLETESQQPGSVSETHLAVVESLEGCL